MDDYTIPWVRTGAEPVLRGIHGPTGTEYPRRLLSWSENTTRKKSKIPVNSLMAARDIGSQSQIRSIPWSWHVGLNLELRRLQDDMRQLFRHAAVSQSCYKGFRHQRTYTPVLEIPRHQWQASSSAYLYTNDNFSDDCWLKVSVLSGSSRC